MIDFTDPLQSVWRTKSVAVLREFAGKIPQARLELWRRRLGERMAAEINVGKLQRYMKRCGRVSIMPDEEIKQTMMTNPPTAGEMFIFTDGTVLDLDEYGNKQYDEETGAELRKPNRITAYCVEVAPLPGGGGLGQGGMFVVKYVKR